MRKTRLKIDMPAPRELVAGLDQRALHPRLVEAEKAVHDAEEALARARQDLEDAAEATAALPAKVAAGEEPKAVLQAAVSARSTAELLLPALEERLVAARESLLDEQVQARAAVAREAEQRLERIQAIADEVRPVLEAIIDLEMDLNEAASKASGSDELGRQIEPELRRIEWPVTLYAASFFRRAGAHGSLRDIAKHGVKREGTGGEVEAA